MRRGSARWATFGVALGFAACLRVGPSVGGKLCAPDSGDCGADMRCVTTTANGVALDLDAGSGICEVSDPGACDAPGACPPNLALYICNAQLGVDAGGGCFESGDEQLAGSVCMVGMGACRTLGVFSWNGDGGTCVIPAGYVPQAHIGSECHDAGPVGPLCVCDGIDQDCSGVADDFPTTIAQGGLAPSLGSSVGTTCGATGDLEAVLLPDPDGGLTFGGASVGSCAHIAFGHAYAIKGITVNGRTITGALASCAAGTGIAGHLLLFGARLGASDGGVVALGSLAEPTSSSDVAYAFSFDAGAYADTYVCLPASETSPFGILDLGVTRALDPAAGLCDQN